MTNKLSLICLGLTDKINFCLMHNSWHLQEHETIRILPNKWISISFIGLHDLFPEILIALSLTNIALIVLFLVSALIYNVILLSAVLEQWFHYIYIGISLTLLQQLFWSEFPECIGTPLLFITTFHNESFIRRKHLIWI